MYLKKQAQFGIEKGWEIHAWIAETEKEWRKMTKEEKKRFINPCDLLKMETEEEKVIMVNLKK